jgi:hypothetical protein
MLSIITVSSQDQECKRCSVKEDLVEFFCGEKECRKFGYGEQESLWNGVIKCKDLKR